MLRDSLLFLLKWFDLPLLHSPPPLPLPHPIPSYDIFVLTLNFESPSLSPSLLLFLPPPSLSLLITMSHSVPTPDEVSKWVVTAMCSRSILKGYLVCEFRFFSCGSQQVCSRSVASLLSNLFLPLSDSCSQHIQLEEIVASLLNRSIQPNIISMLPLHHPGITNHPLHIQLNTLVILSLGMLIQVNMVEAVMGVVMGCTNNHPR
jgi:hypothetical protein